MSVSQPPSTPSVLRDPRPNSPQIPAPSRRPATPQRRHRRKTVRSYGSALRPSHYHGILACDWADRQHELRYWDAHANDGAGVIQCHRIASQPESLHPYFQKLCAALPPGQRIALIVESHSGSFIAQAQSYPQIVIHPVNPKQSANFRKAFNPSGAKSDAIDADCLLEIGVHHLDKCPPMAPQDSLTRRLGLLSEGRRKLVNERTALTNQLTASLKSIFPQALELCGDLSRPLAWDFLEKWPSLTAAQKARPATLKVFYHRHHSRRPELIEERLKRLREAVAVTHDEALLEHAQLHILSLVRRLRATGQSILDYEERLAELTPTHPDVPLFDSVPGAGPCLVPRLIALFGTDRSRWPDADSLLTYSGVAPRIESSGRVTTVRFRHACPRFARQTLVELAGTSLRVGCAWVKAFHEQKSANGWHYNRILRAIAFKWGRILWRLWQDRVPYDEAKRTPGAPNPSPPATEKTRGEKPPSAPRKTVGTPCALPSACP